MKALDRYVLGQLTIATLAVAGALTLMVWLTQSLRFFDYIVNHGLPFHIFVMLAAVLMPSFLTIVLPIAAFVSTLFIYNKLTTESELIVMRAAGMSPLQVARPALVLMTLVVLTMYAISLYVLPLSFRNFKDLQHEIRSSYSAVFLQAGVFLEVQDGVVMYLNERLQDGRWRGVLLHDTRDESEPVTIVAEAAELLSGETGPSMVLYEGQRQTVDPGTRQLTTLAFARYTLELDERVGDERVWREPQERYLHEIFRPPQDGNDEQFYGELIAHGHARVANPLYVVPFVLLGLAPFFLGGFSRRGYARQILAVVGVVVGLQIVMLVIEDMASNDLNLVPAIYAAPLVPSTVLAWALFVRQRATRPGAPPVPAQPATP